MKWTHTGRLFPQLTTNSDLRKKKKKKERVYLESQEFIRFVERNTQVKIITLAFTDSILKSQRERCTLLHTLTGVSILTYE